MDVRTLAGGLVAMAAVIFLAVQAGVLLSLWRRRRRPGLAAEATWTLVPALVLAILFLLLP